MKRLKHLGSRGDTIVEVMIVLAILGLAIGISYATANRSLLATRQAQENSQATVILQAQVEKLRSLACQTGDPNCSTPENIFQTSSDYCVDDTLTINNILTPNNFSTYPARCVVNGRYYVDVKYGGSVSNDTFTIKTSWDDVSGQGTDTSTITYRLHQ